MFVFPWHCCLSQESRAYHLHFTGFCRLHFGSKGVRIEGGAQLTGVEFSPGSIRRMTSPCIRTSANGHSRRNLPRWPWEFSSGSLAPQRHTSRHARWGSCSLFAVPRIFKALLLAPRLQIAEFSWFFNINYRVCRLALILAICARLRSESTLFCPIQGMYQAFGRLTKRTVET